MKFLTRYPIDDQLCLSDVIAHYANLAKSHVSLLDAYHEYELTSGSTDLVPVPLDVHQRRSLKSAYDGKSEVSGCNWIKRLKLNRLLTCPYCGGGGGRTIDHYLPQAAYPEFSVFSLNLISSCGDCNRKRNDYNEPRVKPQLLHPYYERELWEALILIVGVSLLDGVPDYKMDFNFTEFSDEDADRIDNHLFVNIDDDAFQNRVQGVVDVLRIEFFDKAITEVRTEVVSKLYLAERTGQGNSWDAALYRGLLQLSDEDLESVLVEPILSHV